MDAIRGCAAILVMLGHSRDLFLEPLNAPAASTSVNALSGSTAMILAKRPPASLGLEAVMIFFVLSGFLVGGSVLRAFQCNRWSWKEYLVKRLTRLWVVLLPALILTVLLDRAGLWLFSEPTGIYAGPPAQVEVRAHLLKTLAAQIIAGNAAFLQNIFVTTPGTNLALWSLSNEFWYYLIFPLLVILCWRFSTPAIRIVSATLSAALLYFIGVEEITLFPIWILGAAIALLPLRFSDRKSKWLTSSLAVLLLPTMVIVRRIPMDERLAELCIALYFGVLLYAVLHRTRPAGQGMYRRTATFLSNLSYPLYLVHLPVLVFMCAIFNRPWHQWPQTPLNFAIMFGIDATAIGVAYIFHLAFQAHTAAIRMTLLGQRKKIEPVAV